LRRIFTGSYSLPPSLVAIWSFNPDSVTPTFLRLWLADATLLTCVTSSSWDRAPSSTDHILCCISSTVQGCHTTWTSVPRWEPFSYAPYFVSNKSCSSELAQAIMIMFSTRYLYVLFSAKQQLALHVVEIGLEPRCCICRHAADSTHACFLSVNQHHLAHSNTTFYPC
jgi:hypothetical protein